MQPTPPRGGLVRGVPFSAYLRVSKKATILVASSSVRPTLGMAVPGLTAGGFMIQRLRSSGPLLGTAPPAMRVREALKSEGFQIPQGRPKRGRSAADELGEGRTRYPGEPLWATLQEVITIAKSVRGALAGSDFDQATIHLKSSDRKIPDTSFFQKTRFFVGSCPGVQAPGPGGAAAAGIAAGNAGACAGLG